MNKKSTSCGICENSNLSSFCAGCVNYRLSECYACLRSLHRKRSSLYARLEAALEAKKKMDDQLNWRLKKKETIKNLKERLHNRQKQLSQERKAVAKDSDDLNSKLELLESAFSRLKEKREDIGSKFQSLKCTDEFRLMAISSELLHKQAVVLKQISKIFPMRRETSGGDKKDGSSGPYDTICDARLPRGLDPLSVPSDELSASLGYMVQLLNLVIPNLAAPTLHNSGFAGSCSRTWQRDSYWDARPSSQSKEYPLFFPREILSSTSEASWSERSSANFGDTPVESGKRNSLDSTPSSSFSYVATSSRSPANQKDLQKGISLLKRSVACVTAYCNNLYCLNISPEGSTFEAFAKVLSILSSSKEMRAAISLKTAKPKSENQSQPLNESIWNANSTESSTITLLESAHSLMMMGSPRNNLLNSAASFLYPGTADPRKMENLADGWHLIEHPVLPPPSQPEDIEHWTRAMFIDASSK